MLQITTVETKNHGTITVTAAIDEAGNTRMIPTAGAATLDQWRADHTLLPPWLLPSDLAEHVNWSAVMAELGATATA